MVQELVHGVTTFMWAMFELNPRTLDALVTLNVERPSAALKTASSDPRDWPAILVSPALNSTPLTGTYDVCNWSMAQTLRYTITSLVSISDQSF